MKNAGDMAAGALCTGCGACGGCAHIRFEKGPWRFPVPAVDQGCTRCGQCLKACPCRPDAPDED